MKKKLLLLTVLVIALTCIFAISVSAAEPDTTKECVTLSDGTVCPLWDTEGNALCWYLATDNTEDGYANYDYVLAQDTEINANGQYYAGGMAYRQIDLISVTVGENTYTSKAHFVVVNLRDDDALVTSSNFKGQTPNGFENTFYNSKVIEYAYLREDTVALQKQAFQNCTNLKYVNLSEMTKLSNIIGQCFSGCSSFMDGQILDLSKTNLTVLRGNAFANTKFIGIVFPEKITTLEGSSLERTNITSCVIPSTITSFGEYVFRSCTNLKTVSGFDDLFDREVLTGIPKYTFEGCTALTTVDFPDDYSSIGEYAFKNCQALTQVFKVPAACTTLVSNSFHTTYFSAVILSENCTTIEGNAFRDSKVPVIYMPASVKSIASEAFRNMPSNAVVYYVGTKAKADLLKNNVVNNVVNDEYSCNANYNNLIVNATVISLEEYNKLATKSGNYLVYDYSACDAFYDGQHTNAITYGFDGEDKLTSNYCKYDGCTRCDEKTTTPYGTLITNKGYSKEQGGTYFVYTIVFNKDVISLYLANTEGATFSYGVVAAKYTEDASTGILFDEAGAPIKDCVAIDATGAAYSVYSLKITDLDKVENAKSQALYCCAYVVDNGAIKYVADEITNEAVTICYDDIDVIIDTATTPPATGEENA